MSDEEQVRRLFQEQHMSIGINFELLVPIGTPAHNLCRDKNISLNSSL